MQGKDFLQELDSVIEYQNANSVTVYVSSTDGSGSFVLGNGEKSLKPGDSFDLEFKVNSNYEFRKWIAVDKDDQTKNLSSYVQFSPKNEAKTKVTLLEECQNILIMPLCQERPRILIDQITPAYDRDGIPFNSTIKLPVSNYLKTTLEESGLTLSITSTIGDIKDYFHKPIIDGGNTIKLRPNPEKYDDILSILSNGKATITITIPAGWTDNDDIECTSETVYSYVINNTITSNNESVDVTFEVDEAVGELSVFGTNKIYVDTTYKITATISQDYIFDHWGVFYKGSDQEIANARNIIHFAQDNGKDLSSTTFTMYYSIPNIIVKPVCFSAPKIISTLPEKQPKGVEKNSAIEITFNHEIDINSFRYSEEELAGISFTRTLSTSNGEIYGYVSSDGTYVWKNIEISSFAGTNMLAFFSNPDFYESKTLKIIANDTVPDDTTIIVKINKSFYYTAKNYSGNEIQIKGSVNNDEYFEFSYSVNNTLKQILPEFSSLSISGKKEYFAEGTEIWAEKNRCADTFDYSVLIFDETATDEDLSSTLCIDRRLLCTADGINVKDNPVQLSKVIPRTKNNKPFTSEYTGTYDLSALKSGIYQFDFYIKSATGNITSVKKSYLIAHTNIKDFNYLSIYNEGYSKNSNTSTLSIGNMNEMISNFHIAFNKKYVDYVYQKYNEVEYKMPNALSEYKVYVLYGNNYSKKIEVNYDSEKIDSDNYYYYFEAPADFFGGADTPIKVFLEDSYGCLFSIDRTVPCTVVNSYYYDNENGKRYIQTIDNNVPAATEDKLGYNVLYNNQNSSNPKVFELMQEQSNPYFILDESESEDDTYTVYLQKVYEKSNVIDNNAYPIFGKIIQKTGEKKEAEDLTSYDCWYDWGRLFSAPQNSCSIKTRLYTSVTKGNNWHRSERVITLNGEQVSLSDSQTGNGTPLTIKTPEDAMLRFKVIVYISPYGKRTKVGEQTKEINLADEANKAYDSFPPLVKSYEQNKFTKFGDKEGLRYKSTPIKLYDWNGINETPEIYYSKNPTLTAYEDIVACEHKPGKIVGEGDNQEIWVDVKDLGYFGNYAYAVIKDKSPNENYVTLPLGYVSDCEPCKDDKLVTVNYYYSSSNQYVQFYRDVAESNQCITISQIIGNKWVNKWYSNRYYFQKNSAKDKYLSLKIQSKDGLALENNTFCKFCIGNPETSAEDALGFCYYFYFGGEGTLNIKEPAKVTNIAQDFIMDSPTAYKISRNNDETNPTFIHVMYSKTNFDELYGTDSIKYWERYGTETEAQVITKDTYVTKDNVPSGYYCKLIGHCKNGYVYYSEPYYKK